MKHMKKFASVLLALVMVLGLATTAMADDDPSNPSDGNDESTATGKASITIEPKDTNGENNTEYTYYQLLRATVGTETDKNGQPTKASYFLLNGEDDDLRTALGGLFVFEQTTDGKQWNVTGRTDAAKAMTDEEFANALNTDAIKDKRISFGTFSMDATTHQAKATNLDIGYYLITSTLGSNLVLQTLGDVKITTKNEHVTNEKTADKNSMSIGDTVTYTVTVNIPASANAKDGENKGDTVTVYDKLDEKLTFKSDTLKAYIYTKNESGEYVQGEPVTLGDGEDLNKEYAFVKTFEITKEMLGNKVVLTYGAELLSGVKADEGYVNTVVSHTPGYKTTPSEKKVYTFDFDLDKTFTGVDKEDAENYVAKFELYATDENGNAVGAPMSFTHDETGYVKVDSQHKCTYAEGTEEDENPICTTCFTELEVNGKTGINIRGLAEGKYILRETETANSYNRLTDDVIVTISDKTEPTDETPSHTVSYQIGKDQYEGDKVENNTVKVVNNQGPELPSTGGIGTTIFYVVGGVLVAAAEVQLSTKKRMSSKA